ncbi:hypothetical protein MPHO_41930 [Mycolicibacterium phocaicum]|nr:hypothetical protein MPHO_41930 [Mycolicibacterium phocaicum]
MDNFIDALVRMSFRNFSRMGHDCRRAGLAKAPPQREPMNSALAKISPKRQRLRENDRPRKRDDPRQGGEEAEVVVDQPRGVGLMHTRRCPGNAHYTHVNRAVRNC